MKIECKSLGVGWGKPCHFHEKLLELPRGWVGGHLAISIKANANPYGLGGENLAIFFKKINGNSLGVGQGKPCNLNENRMLTSRDWVGKASCFLENLMGIPRGWVGKT